jgi:micrococcal nuclease
MPFSQDDTDRMRAALHAALASTSLTEWQRTFLGDMQARFEKYGSRTRLSDKQFAKLKQTLAPFENVTATVRPQVSSPRPRATAIKAMPPARPSYSSRPQSPFKVIRKVRRTTRDMVWVMAVIFGVLAALGGMLDSSGSISPERMVSTTPTSSSSVYDSRDFSVTDGDTVQLFGANTGTRLVGFNTPETYEPRCNQELALGRQATGRLKDLVKAANQVELRLVACACSPGTHGTSECNFGRSCGVLTVDGRDVGDMLIAEGLAVRFQCGRTSCPPLPRPWCG